MAENEKLKPLAEQVLLGEVVHQSKIAERAWDQLNGAPDVIGTWAAIQAFLVAAANISKVLWPSRKKHRARGERLRALLDVDANTLDAARAFRNHLEHYDERVDLWFEDGASAAYVDLAIDSRSLSPLGLRPEGHRRYDPQRKELHFRDETIDVGSVLDTVLEIREKCRPFALVDAP